MSKPMKPCLTYQNGPVQGVAKAFGPGVPLDITEGPCSITCTFAGVGKTGTAQLEVKAGQILLGQPGRPGGQRVSGTIELREGDIVILGEIRLAYTLEPGEPPIAKAAPAPAPTGDAVVMSRRPKAVAAEAAGPAIVITSGRKAAGADAPSVADAPKPAKILFGFLAPEKQKNAYYQLLLVLFLLLVFFSIGALWGSQTKIKEPANADLEPYIRQTLYRRGKAIGWDYRKLLKELEKAEAAKARPLAVWWLTQPTKAPRGKK